MVATKADVRSGAYYDSVVLMQLQRSLAGLPGILDAGVVMGTAANKEILAQTGLLTTGAQAAKADDLIIVVQAEAEADAEAALGQVDELLARRRSGVEQAYCPRSLESAAKMLPNAHWVLISVPGRYAASVARQALHLDKNVFLYSDNVSLDDEVSLKQMAAEKGLMVMGPDCGTAIVNGVGLGFANRVRRGPIGLVAASGTGLQQVSARIHQLGSGITHALGTGGRDLSESVGAVTARQGLDLLIRDPETQVIVLVSKPPSTEVASELLGLARSTDKPVIVDFIGYPASIRQVDNVLFSSTFDEAAELAVGRTKDQVPKTKDKALDLDRFAEGQRFLRGLFSGGTLAYEALLLLQHYLPGVYSNTPLDKKHRLANSMVSEGHTVVDLGEDEFTVGRLHPMMDNDLRIRRLQQEAEDPEVAVILLDVVLGYGAHPDPAGELGPAIARAREDAGVSGRYLEVVAIVVGTDEDPQGFDAQVQKLREAGARVEASNEAAVRYAGRLAKGLGTTDDAFASVQGHSIKKVPLAVLEQPLVAINVGLESFTESLQAQEAPVVQVDWRPPAGGNERLMAILERMRGG